MLSQADTLELVHDRLYPMFTTERARLDTIDLWYRWEHEELKLPQRASQEHRWLAELARTPWLGLVVTTVAQAMYVDGYRSPEERENGTAWATWEANDYDARQIAIHRAALAYGQAYTKVLPGQDGNGRRSVMRGISPRRMITVYADPAEDEWPLYALQADRANRNTWMLRLIDEEAEHFVSLGASGDDPEYIEARIHGAGVTPVVRYANMLDLDGRTDGEVEPFIGVAQRINKTAYDRLLTQHFNSWKVRTVSGIDLAAGTITPREGETQEQAEARVAEERQIRLRQSDMLTAKDPETKFGSLDETPLDGFVNAYGSDIETLAAVAQVPTTALTGKVANLSADAIAELRAGLTQKVTERQKLFGKAHAQALRLAAHLEGDEAASNDFRSRVTWQDMHIRSLAQAVDALGKAAQMLGVPPQALWSRIPGVEKADVDEWKALAAEGDAFAGLTTLLEEQSIGL